MEQHDDYDGWDGRLVTVSYLREEMERYQERTITPQDVETIVFDVLWSLLVGFVAIVLGLYAGTLLLAGWLTH